MSEHLPECQRAYRDHLHRCICKYVLRCEQRMREGWYEVQSETWEQGFRYALNAAREAVAAVEYRPTNPETMVRSMALDAIDAIREDSETPPPLPSSVGVPERRWT